uniref:Uncharacterized protein n=1 Tax=Lates calcarifer TaxID=8187 RepID=A0A4W6D1J6_LATCA
VFSLCLSVQGLSHNEEGRQLTSVILLNIQCEHAKVVNQPIGLHPMKTQVWVNCGLLHCITSIDGCVFRDRHTDLIHRKLWPVVVHILNYNLNFDELKVLLRTKGLPVNLCSRCVKLPSESLLEFTDSTFTHAIKAHRHTPALFMHTSVVTSSSIPCIPVAE